MDCEKFESTLLDELYDELDEVTSAAAKRHVAGCARCAALFSGLKATRRVAVLPIVEPPADLEDRILAAAREAQKVVPIGRRISNVISLAGSWAMRPQTAMAALFLLMIGSSALLIKGKVAKPPSSTMTVSEQGEPVAQVAASPDPAGGDLAQTAPELAKEAKTASAASPAATATGALVPAAPPPAASAYGTLDSPLDGLVARAAPRKAADSSGKMKGLSDSDDFAANDVSRGGGPAGSPPPPSAHYANAPPARAAAPSPQAAGAGGGSQTGLLQNLGAAKKDEESDGRLAEKQQSPPQSPQSPASDFDSAMNAYTAGDYATAIQLWDNGARNGDLNAALWQARAVRESSGCGVAAARFDRVAQQGGVSAAGHDAMFDAARCYRALGQWDAARARLNQLLLVPSYINRAQSELNAMGPKASAKPRAAPGAQQQQQQAAPPAATTNSY